jgi:Tol biopolymer transport system component
MTRLRFIFPLVVALVGGVGATIGADEGDATRVSSKTFRRLLAGFMAAALVLVTGSNAGAAEGDTTRSSVNSAGVEANQGSEDPVISADGRYVVFGSFASNLIANDGNGVDDVFVHDRQTGITTRVSVNSAGDESNGRSWAPSVSADGRYVSFTSEASNLVAGDSNAETDVFVHDRSTGETTRISVDGAGVEGNGYSFAAYGGAISGSGRYVAFSSQASNLVPTDANGLLDAFLHDLDSGETTLVSVDGAGVQADNESFDPVPSDDGRYVVFSSSASNLVPGDSGGFFDVFVHDRDTGGTTKVTVDSSGAHANGDSFGTTAISADGRYVAFPSIATNLVSGDSNAAYDVFVHDRVNGETSRVSVTSTGAQGNADSFDPTMSSNGRYVSVDSEASNLVPNDTNAARDTFVHDVISGETVRVSVSGAGAEGNADSGLASMSAEGSHVVFASDASNLVAGDGNGVEDVFVHELLADPNPPPPPPPPPPPTGAGYDAVGLVDPFSGVWYMRDGSGQVSQFFYGDPGDVPFMGDWDCDGVDTPGLFRQSDAFAYLRNSNTQGIADIRFFFGNPSDIPLAGDFDGNGCDSLSIYRPSEQRFYIINALGANNGGLGAADFSFLFGDPGDKPFVGDFDGDGIDEVGLHRESTGFVYYRNTLTTGIADNQFFFGDPGDRFVSGDWGIVDGVDTPGLFRPGNTTFYFRHTNTQGNADSQIQWGEPGWLPVAGVFG